MIQRTETGTYLFYCPGCKCNHAVNDKWKVDITNNTISPSVLVKSVSLPDELEKDDDNNYVKGPDGRLKGAKDEICHSFVRNGKIQFLNDCTHELVGEIVEMEPVL